MSDCQMALKLDYKFGNWNGYTNQEINTTCFHLNIGLYGPELEWLLKN